MSEIKNYYYYYYKIPFLIIYYNLFCKEITLNTLYINICTSFLNLYL